ncbi:glucosaminidase domain-containing protein [Paraburkholderia phenoliruptrix]|uniref:glucosaminidase domain-containing protein n=1 Tax=Paraburkholderia phenoliruptrix TaxID=252970 RepID=UPI002869986A|nr:glucosaminidase domain-containing protein [Paraburkholderia phenoliruptrix]WMY08882.1 glucosaminidase domain-containing protein [Paraburkholderia phenoliruptrix]
MVDKYTNARKQEFIKDLYCPARQCADETGCSWELILSQAATETGWGEKVLAGTNNIFNIKATPDWQGESKIFNVWEKVHGETVWLNASFRVYPSVLESLRDRQKFLKENPRYARAGLYDEGVKGNLVKEAQALKDGGYATDPSYATKLEQVFNGPTMQLAIAAARKDGCKGCLPTINLYMHDAARVPLANTKVKVSQGSSVRELTTDQTGHAQIQATVSGGPVTVEVWTEYENRWVIVGEHLAPTSPPTAVTLISPLLVVPTPTDRHLPMTETTGAPPRTPGSPTSGGKHQGGVRTYKIKKGDSLSRIAQANSTSYLTLARLNGISSPYFVYPGQVLKLPAPRSSSVARSAGSSSTQTRTSGDGPTSSTTETSTTTGTPNDMQQVLRPDNAVHVVHYRGDADHPQTDVLSARRAPWMAIAEEEFHAGVKRRGGTHPDQHIEEYFSATSLGRQHSDNLPYCAAFVNWCLTRAGFPGNNSASANSLSAWGKPTQDNKPAYGAVAIVHIPPHNSPHVTFVNGVAASDVHGNVVRIATLGGNQGHAHEVSMSSVPASWVAHYRFPSDYVESPEDYHLGHADTDGAQMTAASTH